MKKQISYKILFCLVCLVLSTQSFSQQCTDSTHTDPNPLYVQPRNGTFKMNTFPWWGDTSNSNYLPLNKVTPLTFDSVYSPYFQGFNCDWMRGIETSQDYKPEDGWELIKQDLGYYYGNGSWAGQRFGFGHPSFANTPSAYIILYNKYQAKLRVFVILPTFGETSAGALRINLSFRNQSDSSSALFNNYNKIQRPLDSTTTAVSIYALAAMPISKNLWTYADFPMAYDPCTCYFASDFSMTFEAITTSTLTATGRSLGTSVSIADVQSGNVASNGMKGDEFADNYLTSYLPGDTDAANLVQDFFDAQSYANEISNKSADFGSILKKVFQLGADIASSYGNSLTASGETDKGKIASAMGLGVGSASAATGDFFDLFSSSANNQSSGPMITSSQLVLKGSVHTNMAEAGTVIDLAASGSPNANLAPEYENLQNSSSGPVSFDSYPMYNQPMGLFALLKAPKVNVFYTDERGDVPSTNEKCVHFYAYDYIGHQYQLAENIQYALNPIVDPAATKIFAHLEIEGYPTFSLSQSLCEIDGIPFNFSMDSTSNLNYSGDTTKNRRKILTTPVLPIECLNGVVAFDGFSRLSYVLSTSQTDNLVEDYLYQHTVNIVFSIAYVFKPDEYGKVHSSTQILKYPVALVPGPTGTVLVDTNSFLRGSIPTNLAIGSTNFTDSEEIFAYDTITIIKDPFGTGDLTNSSGGMKYITAGKEVVVEPGVSVGPNITLQIAPGPSRFCNRNPIAPSTVNRDYCHSNNYKAIQGSSSKRDETSSSIQRDDSYFNLRIFPNPTAGKCTIVFDLPGSKNATITLTDLMGRTVKTIDNSWHDKGSTTVQFDTESYSSGIYLVRFSDGEHTVVKRLGIQHTY